MANSINDIAIRMGVDAAGVEAGFRQARNAAVDFTRYLQKQQDDQVRAYTDSFARTELAFNSHINAYRNALDRQVTAEKEAQDQINKIRTNNFMYGVKYGDPYDNPSDRAARRAAMAARQANDQAVLKENNALQQEATALLQKHMTAGERYLAQMKRLEVLKHTYNIQTGQMMLTDDQFARMKTNLILQTIRQQQAQVRLNVAMTGGFGGMAGAAAQASYAVEDFIQVLSMGGGLNMAMMSASNNLSMVARSMFGLSSVTGLIAGSVLPLAIVGTVSLIRYLTEEKKAVFDLSDYYRKLNDEMNRRQQLLSQTNQFERERLEIMQQSSIEQVESKKFDLRMRINEAVREQNRLQQEQANINKRNKDMLLGTTNTADLQKVVDSLQGMNADDAVRYRTELQGIINLYEDLNTAVESGDQQRIRNIASSLNDYIESATIMQSAARDTVGEIAVIQERLQRILTPDNAEEFAQQLTDLARERADNEAVINHAKEMQADNEQILLDLQEKRNAEIRAQAILQQEAHKMQQDEMLFMLRATDAQKELFRIQKEQQQFAGAFPGFMGGGILGGAMEAAFAQQQEQDRIAFLMAQRDALLKEQGSKLGQAPIQGSLVQNAFDAQADAFKQIFEAAAKKPDPQVEKTNELLRKIEEAIKNGGVIKVVP